MLLQGASGRNLSTAPMFCFFFHPSLPGRTDVCLGRGGQRERRGADKRQQAEGGEAGVAAVSVGGSSITLVVKNLPP